MATGRADGSAPKRRARRARPQVPRLFARVPFLQPERGRADAWTIDDRDDRRHSDGHLGRFSGHGCAASWSAPATRADAANGCSPRVANVRGRLARIDGRGARVRQDYGGSSGRRRRERPEHAGSRQRPPPRARMLLVPRRPPWSTRLFRAVELCTSTTRMRRAALNVDRKWTALSAVSARLQARLGAGQRSTAASVQAGSALAKVSARAGSASTQLRHG